MNTSETAKTHQVTAINVMLYPF